MDNYSCFVGRWSISVFFPLWSASLQQVRPIQVSVKATLLIKCDRHKNRPVQVDPHILLYRLDFHPFLEASLCFFPEQQLVIEPTSYRNSNRWLWSRSSLFSQTPPKKRDKNCQPCCQGLSSQTLGTRLKNHITFSFFTSCSMGSTLFPGSLRSYPPPPPLGQDPGDKVALG